VPQGKRPRYPLNRIAEHEHNQNSFASDWYTSTLESIAWFSRKHLQLKAKKPQCMGIDTKSKISFCTLKFEQKAILVCKHYPSIKCLMLKVFYKVL
jgi:hypothetical protein